MMADILTTIQHFYWKRLATEWQKANHHLNETDRTYAAYVAEAEKGGNREEIQSRSAEWSAVREDEQDKVDRLETLYFEKKARRYHVPLPSYGEAPYWEHRITGYRLTVEGIDFIETRLYDKRKKRWDFWFSAIPAITGLVGALIGLLAIWRHSN
jgi:hypothetical protein